MNFQQKQAHSLTLKLFVKLTSFHLEKVEEKFRSKWEEKEDKHLAYEAFHQVARDLGGPICWTESQPYSTTS